MEYSRLPEYEQIASSTGHSFGHSFALALAAVTSPQVIQAFMVGAFGILTIVLSLTDRDVPEIVISILSAIVTYYFASDTQRRQLQAAAADARSAQRIADATERIVAHSKRVTDSMPAWPAGFPAGDLHEKT
jgi:hypothetical protein